ncbi:hypothetical protein [Mammaliicoccus sciuri]|uniref:hypothetical protein n=1 Tax=Mammaliicoccus sciuri TaxID=1296 RepID=UPI0021D04C4D|nr:hypothetical protein [Mammaliicoccus sciuri]UXU70169.1 hypothetical protein MUA36_05670 [Mammaliicoccus sciuri]
MSLRVIQSYHGTGGKEGYKFQVEKFNGNIREYVYVGELKDFPIDQRMVELDGVEYEIIDVYDRNELPKDEEQEVVVFVLAEYTYPTLHKLEWKQKERDKNE